MAPDQAIIGYVRSVNPARRELRVTRLPGSQEPVTGQAWVTLVPRDGAPMRCRIESVRGEGNKTGTVVLVVAAGVPRDTVARAKGAAVTVGAGPRGASRDRFEAEVLAGLDVVDASGARLGTVTETYETNANLVIEVTRCDGGSLLLPAIDPVIVNVDEDRGVIVVGDIVPYAVESPPGAQTPRGKRRGR